MVVVRFCTSYRFMALGITIPDLVNLVLIAPVIIGFSLCIDRKSIAKSGKVESLPAVFIILLNSQ